MAARNQTSGSPAQGGPTAPGGAPEQHHAGLTGAIEDLEVSDKLHPVLQFIVDNIKLLAAGLVVVLLVIAGLGYWEYRQEQALEEASETMGTILAQTRVTERIEALEAFVAEAPESMREGVRMQLATDLAAVGEYERAADVWQAVGAGQDATVRIVSAMGRARALMEADNSVEALSVLEDALAMADDSFAVPLNRMIASAAEDAGKYSRAADALRDLAAGDPTRPQVYLEDKIARLERMHQESQQNTDS